MKKVIFLVCALLTVFSITSCKDKKAVSSNTTVSVNETVKEESVKKENVKKTVSAVILEDGWALYEVNPEDGKLRATAEVCKGDSVDVIVDAQNEYVKSSMTRVLSNKKEDNITVLSVIYDGKNYFARDLYVSAVGAVDAAVVLTETQEYSKADILGITERKLPVGTFVALYTDGTEDFCHGRIYNGTSYGREIYIPRDCVSSDLKSIEIVKTFSKITKDTKVEVADAILNLILDKWGLFTDATEVDTATENYVLDVLKNNNFSEETHMRIEGLVR